MRKLAIGGGLVVTAIGLVLVALRSATPPGPPPGPSDPPTPATGAAAIRLASPVTYSTERAPHFVAAGDLDADGRTDLVVPNCHASTISVFLGEEGGGFRAMPGIPVAEGPTCAQVGHLDGDNHLDVVASCYLGGAVDILWGLGDGRFERQTVAIGPGTEPHAVVIADLDRDRIADLAVANGGSHDVSLLFGDGTRRFGVDDRVGVGERPYSLVAEDLDRDGRLDLVTGNFLSGDVSIVRGRDGRGFDEAITLPTGEAPNIVDVGDLDGDGRLDLAVANCKSDSVSIVTQTAEGGFAVAAELACDRDVTGVAIADLDGAAPADLIVLSGLDANASFYLGRGGWRYERVARVDTGRGPCHFLWEDVDADGSPDLVVPNMESHDLYVFGGR